MRPARENPYRSEAVDSLGYSPAEQVDDLFQLLKTRGFRGQIIGPKGTGKTTLVRDLISRVSEETSCTSIRLSEDFPRLTRTQWTDLKNQTLQNIVFIDGMEQLKPRNQKRLIKKSKRWGGLIITSHSNLRKHEKSLPLLCLTGPTEEEFIDLAQNLDPDQDPEHLKNLFALHQGNVRDAFRHLYDEWASGE